MSHFCFVLFIVYTSFSCAMYSTGQPDGVEGFNFAGEFTVLWA